MSTDSPWATISDIHPLFGYSSGRTAVEAIRAGHFPIPAYKIGRRWVVDREVARQFFLRHRERGLAKLRDAG